MEHVETDVVVVGAGFAGLRAAYELRRAGAAVLLLEARGRLGGRRCETRFEDGLAFDPTPPWLDAPEERWRALGPDRSSPARATAPLARVLHSGGVLQRFRDPGALPLPLFERAALGAVALRVRQLAAASASSSVAEALDGHTAASFFSRWCPTARARALASTAASGALGAAPEELSLLYAVRALGSEAAWSRAWGLGAAAPRSPSVSDLERLVAHLAAPLDAGNVRSSARVDRLERDGDAALLRVTLPDEVPLRVRARGVVLALGAPLRTRLPSAAGALAEPPLEAVGHSSTLTFAARYDRPFWRDDALCGEALCDRGPVRRTFDASPDAGDGVLVGVAEGDDARALAALPERERRVRVLDLFARCFGERARTPRGVREDAWALDPFARGGFVRFAPPGLGRSLYAAATRPSGLVHTAEAPLGEGATLAGSLAAGARAAEHALRALRGAERAA